MSVSGSLIENAMIGFTFTPIGVLGDPATLSQVVDLTPSLVGESIFCETLGFPDENLVMGDQWFLLTAFATANEPDIFANRSKMMSGEILLHQLAIYSIHVHYTMEKVLTKSTDGSSHLVDKKLICESFLPLSKVFLL